ncbi:MAG: hypothetical protein GC206_16515 [Alphaproteobacteria bacterium]|nr:hypothetical protein [Alphaproteobacteria bacterium]
MGVRTDFLAVLGGATAGLIALAAVAAADGIERKPRPAASGEEAAAAPSSEVAEYPDLLGGPDSEPAMAASEPMIEAPLQASVTCPSYEEALVMVRTAMDNAEIGQIDSAIQQAMSDFEGCDTVSRALAAADDVVDAIQVAALPEMRRPPAPRRPLEPFRDAGGGGGGAGGGGGGDDGGDDGGEDPGEGTPPGGDGGPGYTG